MSNDPDAEPGVCPDCGSLSIEEGRWPDDYDDVFVGFYCHECAATFREPMSVTEYRRKMRAF